MANIVLEILARTNKSLDHSRLLREIDALRSSGRYREAVRGVLGALLVSREFTAADALLEIEPTLLTSNDAEPEGWIHEVLDTGDCPDVVQWLLDRGVDGERRGINGWTPLHRAAISGHVGSMCVLLDHGADIEAGTQVDGDVSPLMEAASAGRLWCVVALVRRGADIHRRDTMTGHTAADLALRGSHEAVCDFLDAAMADN